MRFVIALMRHETNTFAPDKTPLTAFNRSSSSNGPLYGEQALQACMGTNNAAAAFIDIARQQGDEFVMPIMANAVPSGIVTSQAFEHMCGLIVAAVAAGCDAVLLDLHGAMVTEEHDDAEGELLRRIRAVAPDIPIAVALDLHANFSDAMVSNATVIAGYCTYPHIDIYHTGARAARTLMAAMRGETRPVLLRRTLPMLTHTLRQSTHDEPMKSLMERVIAAEKNGEVLNASLFGGFPMADISHVGMTIVLVADAKRKEQANQLLDELTQMAWDRRHQFIAELEPLDASIARAKSLKQYPVVLVDHGDNCASGGATDQMQVLDTALQQGLENMVAGPFCDPAAVAQLIAAGVGETLTLHVGGRTDIPALGSKGQPLQLTGRVKCISDGQYVVTGPMFTGVRMSLGRSAVLEVGSVLVVVCEKPQEPYDLGIYTHLGIDPTQMHYILLKSRQHFRAAFEPIAAHIIWVAGPGVCSSDYSQFTYQKLRRPIFPLDADVRLEQAINN
ncbi:MAG: M81 family metallopeptidase [Acidovorax sp.]|jgi:microcystin degradation protein MlrC|nr:M81 family metallopeptidase [Acidovorax sp.]